METFKIIIKTIGVIICICLLYSDINLLDKKVLKDDEDAVISSILKDVMIALLIIFI